MCISYATTLTCGKRNSSGSKPNHQFHTGNRARSHAYLRIAPNDALPPCGDDWPQGGIARGVPVLAPPLRRSLVTGAEGQPSSPASTAASAHASLTTESIELELYKLAVEMADRISARRALANTFFLTVNTGLVALLGGRSLRWYVAAAGIVFALAWWGLLQSYRKINWAKFQVINSIEPRLPFQPFSDEWHHLENTRAPRKLWPFRDLRAWLKGYHDLGTVERIVPLAFAAIYSLELIRQATS